MITPPHVDINAVQGFALDFYVDVRNSCSLSLDVQGVDPVATLGQMISMICPSDGPPMCSPQWTDEGNHLSLCGENIAVPHNIR